MITGISHHRYSKQFATCGETTLLWDTGRNLPLQEFDWGVDTVHSVKFNQVTDLNYI
jgi:WD repeat and SOF domain-containing protein 1